VSATSATASTVRVSLYPAGHGGDPFNIVRLGGGDALYAETGGRRTLMGAGTFDYETSFATGAAETRFTVVLDRARMDFIDAPSSTGLLPAPFDLGALGAELSRAQDLILTWSPSGTSDLMTLDLTGSCVEDLSIPIAGDPGSYSPTLDWETSPSSCQITLTLHRVRSGVIDPKLASGSTFSLEQVRTTSLFAHP
jgi:hypothetical protein